MDTKLAKVSHLSQILSCAFSAVMLAIIVWPLVRPEQRGYSSLWDTSVSAYWPLALLAVCIVGAAGLQLASVLVARKSNSEKQVSTVSVARRAATNHEDCERKISARDGQIEQLQAQLERFTWLHDIAKDQAETIHRFVHITRCVIGKYELFDRVDPYIEFQLTIDNRSVYEICFADPVGVIFFGDRELSGALSWTERAAPTHGNEGVVTLKERLDRTDVIPILNGPEATFDFTRLKLGIKGDTFFDTVVRPQVANLGHQVTNNALLERYPKLDIQIVQATFSIRQDQRIERAITATYYVTIELAIHSRRNRSISIDRVRLYLPIPGKASNVYAETSPEKLSRRQYISKTGQVESLSYSDLTLDNLVARPLRFEDGTSISGGLQFTLGEMAIDDETIDRMRNRRFELALIDDVGEEHLKQGEIELAN